MIGTAIVSILLVAFFCGSCILYTGLTSTGRIRIQRPRPHAWLGPILFVLLGATSSFLGYWYPLSWKHELPADARIDFLINGFAPVTAATAALALSAWLRLFVQQWKSRAVAGWIWLVVLSLPAVSSVLAAALVLRAACSSFPQFVYELLNHPLEWLR